MRAADSAPGGSAENRLAADLFAALPRRYDLLAEVLSFGQNGAWRRELVRHIAVARPDQILDVATGTGGVAMALARATGARVIGVDISAAMLERGRARVAVAGLGDRIDLREARAEDLPFADGAFDAVAFTYLLRYVADPKAAIAELARVVRPGGVIATLDFHVPGFGPWRGLWHVYTRLVLPAAGWLLGGRPWFRVGVFLGPNITGFGRRWPDAKLAQAWRDAGLVDVGLRPMSSGAGLVMWARKPDV